MVAHVSTELQCTEENLWSRLIQPKALQYVSDPVFSFVPSNSSDFEHEWTVGKKYGVRLFLLKMLPLGLHEIELIVMDKVKNLIISRESGTMAKVWNHTIRFEKIDDNRIRYTDEVDIRAGRFTGFVWCFAHIFYRHRQRRWKKLLSIR